MTAGGLARSNVPVTDAPRRPSTHQPRPWGSQLLTHENNRCYIFFASLRGPMIANAVNSFKRGAKRYVSAYALIEETAMDDDNSLSSPSEQPPTEAAPPSGGSGPRRRGPKTAAGKERGSLNAVKHGLSRARLILPGEHTADWDTHRR